MDRTSQTKMKVYILAGVQNKNIYKIRKIQYVQMVENWEYNTQDFGIFSESE